MTKKAKHEPSTTSLDAQEATQTHPAPATTGDAAVAVVSAAPPAPADDPAHGRGGMYQLINGQRVLVHRTQSADEARP